MIIKSLRENHRRLSALQETLKQSILAGGDNSDDDFAAYIDARLGDSANTENISQVVSLKYLDAAKNDLGEIARYIAGESGSANVAVNYVSRIRAHCRKLAAAETSQRGTDRSELVDGMRK